ncbi:hypothetical protein RI367_000812 [Sorochytrium milnesiophthora]
MTSPSASSSPPASTNKSLLFSTDAATQDSPFLIKNRKTHAIPPNTTLLNRLGAFLPQMEQANKDLQLTIAREGQQVVDIESLPASGQQYIQMNLGLGVLEEKSQRKRRQAHIVDLSEQSQERLSEESGSGSDEEDEVSELPPPQDLADLVQRFLDEAADSEEEQEAEDDDGNE